MKWAALAVVAVSLILAGCNNTEEPEVDPRDAYVGTYDLVSQSGSMTISAGDVEQTIGATDWGMDPIKVSKIGSGSLLDVAGMEATLADDRLVFSEPMTQTQTQDGVSMQITLSFTGRVSGGNTLTLDGDISGFGAHYSGMSAILSGNLLLVYSKRD